MYYQIESKRILNFFIVMPRFVDKMGEWYHFPLGIPYISACLKQAGFNVYTINMNSKKNDALTVIGNFIEKIT